MKFTYYKFDNITFLEIKGFMKYLTKNVGNFWRYFI